jgi:hypothetical protein
LLDQYPEPDANQERDAAARLVLLIAWVDIDSRLATARRDNVLWMLAGSCLLEFEDIFLLAGGAQRGSVEIEASPRLEQPPQHAFDGCSWPF